MDNANDEILQLYKKRLQELKNLKSAIQEETSTDRKIDRLKEAYNFLKEIGPDFYMPEENKIYEGYHDIIYCANSLEKVVPNRFVIDLPPYTDAKVKFDRTSEEAILDFLVSKTRNYLYRRNRRISDLPFELLDLRDNCQQASLYTTFLCIIHGIHQKRFKIEPGFIKHSDLYIDGGWHCFNIIIIGSKKFLVDCTYSQFFLETRCLTERTGIMEFLGPAAGAYMSTDSRKSVSSQLLQRGWIELKDGTLKDYLDGFAISNRNGIYYETTNDFSHTTDYTDDIYWAFLYHKDSQLNHEDRTSLGYQYRPLKDSKMKF